MSDQQTKDETEMKTSAFGRVRSALRERPRSRGTLAGSPPGAGGRLLDLHIRPY